MDPGFRLKLIFYQIRIFWRGGHTRCWCYSGNQNIFIVALKSSCNITIPQIQSYLLLPQVADELTLQTQVSNGIGSDRELKSRLMKWRLRVRCRAGNIYLRVTLSERGWLAVKDGFPTQATKADFLKVILLAINWSLDSWLHRCCPVWKRFLSAGRWARRCKRHGSGRWWWTSPCQSQPGVPLQQDWRSAGNTESVSRKGRQMLQVPTWVSGAFMRRVRPRVFWASRLYPPARPWDSWRWKRGAPILGR